MYWFILGSFTVPFLYYLFILAWIYFFLFSSDADFIFFLLAPYYFRDFWERKGYYILFLVFVVLLAFSSKFSCFSPGIWYFFEVVKFEWGGIWLFLLINISSSTLVLAKTFFISSFILLFPFFFAPIFNLTSPDNLELPCYISLPLLIEASVVVERVSNWEWVSFWMDLSSKSVFCLSLFRFLLETDMKFRYYFYFSLYYIGFMFEGCFIYYCDGTWEG